MDQGSSAVANATPTIVLVSLTWALFIALLAQHCCQVYNFRYQAILLRIVMVLPICSTSTFLLSYSGYALIAEFVQAVFEGYVFLAFFGMMCGWAFSHGDVYKALMEHRLTRRMFGTQCFAYGPRFKNGKAALASLWYQAFQLSLIKPTIALVNYFLDTQVDAPAGSAGAHKVLIAKICTAIVSILSVFTATMSLVRLYRALTCASPKVNCSHTQSSKRKRSLLIGLSPFWKFLVIKALVLSLVVDTLVLPHIVPAAFSVPWWLCSDNSAYCSEFLISFVFNVECLVLTVLALFLYRSKSSLSCSMVCHAERDDENDPEAESPRKRHEIATLCAQFFKIFDVTTALLRPVENATVSVAEKGDSLPQEIGLEIEMEGTSNHPSRHSKPRRRESAPTFDV